jgi:hypothetical protein
MFNKIYNYTVNKLTRNKTRVPLIILYLDYQSYLTGNNKNCVSQVHPTLQDDKILQAKVQSVVDWIRVKYDMMELI